MPTNPTPRPTEEVREAAQLAITLRKAVNSTESARKALQAIAEFRAACDRLDELIASLEAERDASSLKKGA